MATKTPHEGEHRLDLLPCPHSDSDSCVSTQTGHHAPSQTPRLVAPLSPPPPPLPLSLSSPAPPLLTLFLTLRVGARARLHSPALAQELNRFFFAGWNELATELGA